MLLLDEIYYYMQQRKLQQLTNIHNVGREDKRWHSCDVIFSDGKVEHLEDDSQLLDYTTIYPTQPQNNIVGATKSMICT